MTCQNMVTLGVYLLGALDPAERSAFEAHLSYCDICRGELVRLAPLPGLLNQITPEDFAETMPPTGAGTMTLVTQASPVTAPVPIPVPVALPSPRDSEPVAGPEDAAPGHGPRRYWWVAAAAAMVVVLAVGAVFGWRAMQEDPAVTVATGVTWEGAAPDGSARAAARLVEHEWGTEIRSKIEGLQPGQKCYLMVYDHYGKWEIAGWWGSDHDPNAEIPGSTSFQRSKIDRLEFRIDEETVVVTITPPRR